MSTRYANSLYSRKEHLGFHYLEYSLGWNSNHLFFRQRHGTRQFYPTFVPTIVPNPIGDDMSHSNKKASVDSPWKTRRVLIAASPYAYIREMSQNYPTAIYSRTT